MRYNCAVHCPLVKISKNTSMLTAVQRGMVNSQIRRLVGMLVYFFVSRPSDQSGFFVVAKTIQDAINGRCQPIDYSKSSTKTSITPSLIAYELEGIFNPDLRVLGQNGLQIVNSPRDKEVPKIDDRQLQGIAKGK